MGALYIGPASAHSHFEGDFMTLVELAVHSLVSPMVLFFVLGFVAAMARSDLSMPEPVTKLLAIYLLMSIGMRGGVEVAHHGVTGQLLGSIAIGMILSFATPYIAFAILRATSQLTTVDAASVAAHYGSISAVTFAAVTGALGLLAISFEGYMVAVAAAMETPAIIAALSLVGKRKPADSAAAGATPASGHTSVTREVLLNGSIVVLIGAFIVGMVTGPRGMTTVKPFLVDLFPGFLCLFLLDMGIVAGRGLEKGRKYLTPALIAFAIVMPLIGAGLGAGGAKLIGLSVGGTAVLMTLAASASYIAVPAAMRLALPEANPAIALTMSLGLTFPFNLLLGIPLYIQAATFLGRGVG